MKKFPWADEAALAALAAQRQEIELFRAHAEAYGYVFYLLELVP